MKSRALVLGLVWLVFTAYSVWAVMEFGGLIPAFKAMVPNVAAGQVALDLVISLVLIAIWVYGDAPGRGLSRLWIVAVLCLGSIGTLLYLTRRELAAAQE